MLANLLQTGIGIDQPVYLQKKIRLSNILCLIISLLSFPYIVFTYFWFPQLLIYPILAFSGGIISLLLNILFLTTLSRIITAINVPFMLAVYHGYLIQVGEPIITGLYIIQLSLIVVPILIFDLREKALLFSTTVVPVMLFLSMPIINMWFDMPLDNAVFRTGTFAYFSYTIGVIMILSSLVTLIGDNLKAELRSEKLIVDAEQRNEELKNSENTLKEYISKINQSQQEEQKRAWAAEGFAMFSDLLRKNNEDLKKLSEDLISSITKYLKASQGALFILNSGEQSSFMELSSCYAYNRQKFKKAQIEMGQGLVGQAWIEKNIVYMTSVPDDYVHITSGLGEALPRSILIVPMMMDEEVLGVLEFASFNTFEEFEIDFIRKVGESIASTLKNVQTAEKTKRLLTASQQVAEELKSQEEELRQNIEELLATQENHARLQKELLEKEKELLNNTRELEEARQTIKQLKNISL